MVDKLLKVSFLPCLCLAFAAVNADDLSAVSANAEEDQLLNEFVKDKLAEIGINTNLRFYGDINTTFASTHQTLDRENPTAVIEGNVYIAYDNRYGDLGYGLNIGNKIKSGELKQGAAIVDTSYLYLQSDKYGKVKFGYTNSAGDEFSLTYAAVLTGYKGPDSGNLSAFSTQTSGTIIGTGFDRDDSKALKVVWLSPKISGWTFGLSYSPNSRDGHLFMEKRNKLAKDYHPSQNFADQSSYSKHNVSGGIAYEHGCDKGFYGKVAVAGWWAKGEADHTKVKNVAGYNVGALLGYKNYKLAFGFTDNGTSMLPEKLEGVENPKVGFLAGADAGKIYNIGIGCTLGKAELSAGFFHAVRKFSHNERTNTNITTLAAQYNFNKTLSTYIEYNHVRARTCERSFNTELDPAYGGDGIAFPNNDANIFMIGAKVNF